MRIWLRAESRVKGSAPCFHFVDGRIVGTMGYDTYVSFEVISITFILFFSIGDFMKTL